MPADGDATPRGPSLRIAVPFPGSALLDQGAKSRHRTYTRRAVELESDVSSYLAEEQTHRIAVHAEKIQPRMHLREKTRVCEIKYLICRYVAAVLRLTVSGFLLRWAVVRHKLWVRVSKS
jgi:hypothetical protein